eukprot:scaffold160081_cov43-Attheya_sp.AAC.1
MMKEFNAAKEVRPTKEDMLTMGENENYTYNTFCDYYILPAVCGRKSNEAKFNKNYLSKVATANEAFALLSLENAWDRWVFQLDNPDSDHIPATAYSHEGSSARALISSGWKKLARNAFQTCRSWLNKTEQLVTTCSLKYST